MAKKIVIVAPYTEARTEERKKLCESMGYQVLATRSLGLERRVDIQELSPWVIYRMAKDACIEAPGTDAIYVCCPEWHILPVIEEIERDTGKPVVAQVNSEVRAWLRILHIKEPIEGYGKLLGMI